MGHVCVPKCCYIHSKVRRSRWMGPHHLHPFKNIETSHSCPSLALRMAPKVSAWIIDKKVGKVNKGSQEVGSEALAEDWRSSSSQSQLAQTEATEPIQEPAQGPSWSLTSSLRPHQDSHPGHPAANRAYFDLVRARQQEDHAHEHSSPCLTAVASVEFWDSNEKDEEDHTSMRKRRKNKNARSRSRSPHRGGEPTPREDPACEGTSFSPARELVRINTLDTPTAWRARSNEHIVMVIRNHFKLEGTLEQELMAFLDLKNNLDVSELGEIFQIQAQTVRQWLDEHAASRMTSLPEEDKYLSDSGPAMGRRWQRESSRLSRQWAQRFFR
jgi:hypothetical protein